MAKNPPMPQAEIDTSIYVYISSRWYALDHQDVGKSGYTADATWNLEEANGDYASISAGFKLTHLLSVRALKDLVTEADKKARTAEPGKPALNYLTAFQGELSKQGITVTDFHTRWSN